MSNENKGCLFAFLPIKEPIKNKNTADNEEKRLLPMQMRDDFLSPAELSFYKTINQILDENITICPKVALKDIIFVNTKDNSEFRTLHNKINRKHVDFVLCNTDNMKMLCAIELDDKSHNRSDRIERDTFVDLVFESAKLPLIRFENRNSYNLNEIKEILQPVISQINTHENKNIGDAENQRVTVSTDTQIPICPKCSIPMIKRITKRGENKGKEFWGCSNFPKCREIIQ